MRKRQRQRERETERGRETERDRETETDREREAAHVHRVDVDRRPAGLQRAARRRADLVGVESAQLEGLRRQSIQHWSRDVGCAVAVSVKADLRPAKIVHEHVQNVGAPLGRRVPTDGCSGDAENRCCAAEQ